MGDHSRPVIEAGQPPARMRESWPGTGEGRSALPLDESRVTMIRRQARMSLAGRIALFEALSMDAAWARAAMRVR